MGFLWCHLCEAIAVSSYMITHFLTFSHSAHSAWDYGLLWICISFETVVSYDIKMTQQSLLKNLGSSRGCLTFCFGLKQIDEISEKFLSWKFRVQL